MADKQVIRQDVVQIGFEVIDNPLNDLIKSMNEFQKAMKKASGEIGEQEKKNKKNTSALQKMANTANAFKSKLSPALTTVDKTLKKIGTTAIAAGKKVASGLGKVGKSALTGLGNAAKTAFKGLVAGAAAFGTALGVSVKNYAEYEQLVGGVKKIFNDAYTPGILNDANEAYINLGMSANEYLSAMNNTGATFAATMGDQKGYVTAKKGMQAISDYATGTGKDINELSEKFTLITRSTSSYQSIADQFSGILPATSKDFLKQAQSAGFLSKKYTELTKVPVAEYQEAVAKMLEKGTADLGLAGNTAAEATQTLSGSLGMAKAAWSNFLTGMADPSQDFDKLVGNVIDSVVAVGKNLIPIIVRLAPRLGKGLLQLAKAAGPYIPPLLKNIWQKVKEYAPVIWQKIVEFAPVIGSKLKELLFKAKDFLVKNSGAIWDGFKTILANGVATIYQMFTGEQMDVEGLKTKIQEVVDKAMGFVNAIKENWPTIQKVLVGVAIAIGSVKAAIFACNAIIAVNNAVTKVKAAGDALMAAKTKILNSSVWASVKAFGAQAIALMTNPVTWIVIGIIALVAAIILLIKNWDKVKEVAAKVWAKVKEIWGKVSEWFSTKVIQPIVGFFTGLWDSIKAIFKKCLDWIKENFKSIILFIINPFAGVFNYLYENFEGFRNFVDKTLQAIKDFFVNLWNNIKQGAQNWWENVKSVFGAIASWVNEKVISPVVDFFKNLWSRISEIAGNIKSSIVDAFQSAWDKVTGVWDGIKDFFSGIWDGLKDTGSALKESLLSVWKEAVKAIAKPVNKLIGGANWVLEKLGSDKIIAEWQPYARGTNGHPGGNAIVNDGRGAELVQFPNGRTFIPKGRNVAIPNAPKGMKVLDAQRTAQLFGKKSPTFNYEGGIGDWAIWDFFDNAKGLVSKVIDKFVSFKDMSGYVLDAGKAMISSATGAMSDWIKGLFKKHGGRPLSAYDAAAGVEQWRSTVSQALSMEGLNTAANINRTLYQMKTESGGNPHAINNWDSNAKKGTPSKGLMQVIDPTFQAYARKGYNSNIYDPLSNILASVRYAMARYGSLENAYRGVGYANGIGYAPSYTPASSVPVSGGSSSNTNNYSPSFTLNMNGTVDRTTERTIKRWVMEALNDAFDSMERTSGRITEV